MDLKRLRTFVAVADLGTVSKAALHQRISQSALSRQISDLEYECGFKLFDRIGRRLFLTTRGEQLLGDCRGVLGHMGLLGERIELLKRGDSGVLKLAAPPQTIESVLSGFLPQYAERFPNVRVKLTEALGLDQDGSRRCAAISQAVTMTTRLDMWSYIPGRLSAVDRPFVTPDMLWIRTF